MVVSNFKVFEITFSLESLLFLIAAVKFRWSIRINKIFAKLLCLPQLKQTGTLAELANFLYLEPPQKMQLFHFCKKSSSFVWID